MKIGATERGDAGLDLSWAEKLPTVDGAILITKNLTDKFIDKVIEAHQAGYKLIVHAGCTGWSGSPLEPNTPMINQQLFQLAELIHKGFPRERCVLRIDPIIPNDDGLRAAHSVIISALQSGILPNMRVRISIYDEYPHVKRRLIDAGFRPFYPDGVKYAPKELLEAANKAINAWADAYDIRFETCAEPAIAGDRIDHIGCVSTRDLDILEIEYPELDAVNPQGRLGCLCLSGKTELLAAKRQCPHQCMYCYWRIDHKPQA